MRISDWSSDVCSSDLIDGDPAVQPPDVVCRLRPRNYDVGIGCIACAGENAFETPFVFRRQPYTGEGRTSIPGYRLYGFSFGLPCEHRISDGGMSMPQRVHRERAPQPVSLDVCRQRITTLLNP